MPVGDLREKDSPSTLVDGTSTLEALCVLGVSYRTAGLDVRSRLSFQGDRLLLLLSELSDAGADQCLVLSTCNRTEIYFAGTYPEIVSDVLCQVSGVSNNELESHCYFVRGEEAARHVFRVASGLDSAALGETEILAQLKQALRQASEGGHIGGALNLLFRRALNVSKRVRSETELCRNVTSIASMAVRQAALVSGGLAGRRVLLVGAGVMGERLAKELTRVKAESVTLINRTVSKAEALASEYGFAVAPFDLLPNLMHSNEVVFCAIAADTPVITASELGQAKCTIVDLGVPGVVQPGIETNATIIDMQLLAEACSANGDLRSSAVKEADRIIGEEVDGFIKECAERDVAPAITALVSLGEHVRRENVQWAMCQLSHLLPTDKKIVEDLAYRLMRGMLQGQIAAMKSDSLSLQEKACLASVFRDISAEAASD